MALSKMKQKQLDSLNEFNFDPPPATSSNTSLRPNLYTYQTSLAAPGSAGYASNNPSPYLPADMVDPFVSGDLSQLYQPASELDTEGVNSVTNGAVGNDFGSAVPDTNPGNAFENLSDEQFARMLQASIERGPSPTQGTDQDWSDMTTVNSVNESTANVETSQACAPGAAATDIANTPAKNVSAAPSTSPAAVIASTPTRNVSAGPSASPATPGSASRSLLEKMSNSPIEIPRTSQFAGYHPASPARKKKSPSAKKRTGDPGPASAKTFSPSPPVGQNTPGKQKLGSPFKMPGLPASSPARQVPSDYVPMDCLYPPRPAAKRSLSMDNTSPGMTALPGYTSALNSQMQDMRYQRNRTVSSNHKSPPNAPGFANGMFSNGGSGSFFGADLPSGEPSPAKRARKDAFGAQAVLANAAWEEQMRHQTYFQQASQAAESVGMSLAHHFSDHVVQDFKWLERDRTDPEPPPSTMARNTGYEFPIPLPTGTMGSIEEEEEDDDVVIVGQKRKAGNISEGGNETNNIQDPCALAGLDIGQNGLQYLGMFVPYNQAQYLSQGPQTQLQSPQKAQQTCGKFQGQYQPELQSPRKVQRTGGQFEGQHRPQLPSPRKVQQARGQTQGRDQPQHQMHGRAQAQGQFHSPQGSSNSRASNWQQMQQPLQGRREIPHCPVNEQAQGLGSSLSVAGAKAPGTPTPTSRHHSTLSRAGAGQKAVSGSPYSGTPRRNVQTPNGQSLQTPIGRSFQTPNNKPMQNRNQSFSQTPNQTPPNETPAVLRQLHLPTPEQPISSGSCPNTMTETLEETNRRTANQLQSLGAEVVDYDPNMNWDDNTADGSFGALFGDIGLLTPGAGEGTFSQMMGLDMLMPATIDKYMPQGGKEDVAGAGLGIWSTAVSTSNHTTQTDGFDTSYLAANNHNNYTATDALVPENAASSVVAMASDASFETGAAMSTTAASANQDFLCDWTNGFAEDKSFDPIDFGF
ncbi:uncharacterized protein Z520_11961 [Fonsecaea multimorphosa CBS 102226]|uniref:Uncharacterized protein n=1 Tax=Fonsecaea multimorphosa CBS 102226 TaxID=1442371 RepID=A0A0D2K7P6_9EURO|nr:uncharacterized protein Z520_11961 [Fonsecaea multimorphosa CBS 102226]KIX92353.1 hypothetical protein Z520_11961 [Fonsecaea multimorphosa CBS 102226]OAL17726.1 hypothetical protein AYO22_11382 [Fonsecaea multimorphosa]